MANLMGLIPSKFTSVNLQASGLRGGILVTAGDVAPTWAFPLVGCCEGSRQT